MCSAARTGSRSCFFPDGAFSQVIRDPSGSQPPPGASGSATVALTRATTCPPASRIAVISSWPGKFRSKQVTRPANSSGRRRASRFSRVCSPARLLPRIAPGMARPARAARATTRSCGNGEESSPVPVEPNMARFAGVSARFTSIPSAASTVIPASSTADGSPSPMSGPAACQNRSSITSAGTRAPASP